MLAVGGHFIEDLSERMICMATGLSGGIGVTFRDLCGALTAGVMVIGALHGRSNLSTGDTHCQEMAATYRTRFAEAFGSVYCHELRATKYGSQGQEPCSVLVERAARILMVVLEE
jgi:C_GCAxxG_C_C family probable redox protein